MSLTQLSPIANHLWQSTAFAGLAAVSTLLLRNNRARVRHWVWIAASWKFVIPFSLFMSLGSHLEWRTSTPPAQSPWSTAIDVVTQPFAVPVVASAPRPGAVPVADPVSAVLWTVWACGFLAICASWWSRWRHLRAAIRANSPIYLDLPVPAVSSPTQLEPGIFGVFRPVLLLPEGIFDRLTVAQLEGVLAHELCHVRHRDNLIAAVQMAIETVLWFHPMVWWLGRRMVEERERACDEEVLSLGCEPRVYAEGILAICKLYTESRLVCVSGASGSNLAKRIEAIMRRRNSVPLDFKRKAALALFGMAALVAPIGIGMLDSPVVEAQSPAAARFEVASIKPTSEQGADVQGRGEVRVLPGGHLLAEKVLLRYFIQNAYGVKPFQVSGGPAWTNSAHYNIDAKAEGNPSQSQMRLMMRGLLEERFHLKLHHRIQRLPVYDLTVARSGLKLPDPKAGSCIAPDPNAGPFPPAPGQPMPCGRILVMMEPSGAKMQGGKVSMADLVSILSNVLGRPVVDKTGFRGMFDLHLEFAADETLGGIPTPPPAPAPSGDSARAAASPGLHANIFAAIQEQLGLKLASAKGPVDVLVIDSVERPSSN